MKRALEVITILLFVLFVSLADCTGWIVQVGFFVACCASVALLSLLYNKD